MIDLLIRKSALYNRFYIDYKGMYRIEEIAKALQIELETLKSIYVESKGDYDENQQVYYFDNIDFVKDCIGRIVKTAKPSQVEKKVFLTYEEIEYIRRALINEDSNVIFTGNAIRSSIFDKLNR